MKKILFVLIALIAFSASAQKYSLDNETRIEFANDTLIVKSAVEGDPVVGYHVEGNFTCINFRWHATKGYYYLVKRTVSTTMRVGFRGNKSKEVCLRIGTKGREYYLGKAERDAFLKWLDR